jgi:hypothetical protein
MRRLPGIAAAVVLVAVVTGCGAGETANRGTDGVARFHDGVVGVSGEYPAGWHRARNLTNMAEPREVLALASYPLRGGDRAGECAPKKALADLPPDGAFIWLLEYRPARGEVWADLPRSRFPPRPSPIELSRRDLQTGLCQSGPGYGTAFRAADRPFQLLVAFGTRVSDARLSQAEAVLNSLRFDSLPPPPADPYAGWPLVNDNSGDSLRPPPGWTGAAVTYRPGKTARPRLLFFTSNRPLWGLPEKLVPRMDEPAGDDYVPTAALANDFPPDGVVVFVLEEAPGEPSREYWPVAAAWPARDDFKPGEIATQAAPDLRWLRAGGSFSGYRFSVWIGRAPEASRDDLRLALKSAASLALSGCWRERYDDCPDR